MKKTLFFLILFSSIFSLNIVVATVPEPQRCPGIAPIISLGVSRNVVQADRLWFAGRRHSLYDTTDPWTFILGNISASNASEAYTKASSALQSIHFQIGPFLGPLDKWVCLYNTIEGYPAVAITTPIALNLGPNFLR